MKYKLICFDMDGVIFQHQNFWMELHKEFGTYEEGKRLTEKHLKTNYNKLVEEVVTRLWKGKKADKYFDLIRKVKYISGVKETFKELKKLNLKTALITSGPSHLAQRAQKDLGIDFIFANELVIKNNIVSGEFNWPLGEGKKEKVGIVKELAKKINTPLNNVVYVGDHENDIDVSKIVGLSIAFNCSHSGLAKIAKVNIKKQDLREISRYLK